MPETRQPGDKHHLASMARLELMFHKNLGVDEFYRQLIKFIDKELPIAISRPLTFKELGKVDNFTKSYFSNKLDSIEMIITRAFILAKFVEGRERMPRKPMIDIEELPKRVKTAIRKYNLTPTETRALEWSMYNASTGLTNATNDTSNRVSNLLFENITKRAGHRALRKALEEEAFTDKGEINRNWKRVSISATNTAFNQGYIATLKQGEWVQGFSMPDACDYCKKYIKGKIYMVIDPDKVDLNYEDLDPESAKYKQISFLYDNAVWVNKSNIGRSSSPRKRKDPDIGNVPDNLEPRGHHERWTPITPAHIRCRCRVIRISVDTMFVQDGKLEMKVMNEKAWKNWYDNNIQAKLDRFRKIGVGV